MDRPIEWECPDCTHLNVDEFDGEIIPECEVCGASVPWHEIMDDGE